MAHHSSQEIPEDLIAAITEIQPKGFREEFLGPTGRFPEGKLTKTDEGEIQIGLTHKDGKVVLAFGKAITWIGFTPRQADDIADALRSHAEKARAIIGRKP